MFFFSSKDRLLAELYQKHKVLVEEYFEHDSLLEDRPDENLTEEEQRAAWDEFENEKELLVQRRKGAS
jgi:transcriptional regulator ATRX